MKILVFGNSHMGALMRSFYERESAHHFFNSNSFEFVGVIGKNFRKIKASKEKSEIILPENFLSRGDGAKQRKITESGITINFCNFADYDIVIWAQGLNLIHVYHSMLGGSKEYNPAFLTRGLAKVVFERVFKFNKLFSKLRSETPNTRFVYTGQPISFSYKAVVNKKRFANANSVHLRNINYLRDTLLEPRKELGLVMSPDACIHASGLFSLEEFARDIKQDTGHAGLNYGKHLWKEIIQIIQ